MPAIPFNVTFYLHEQRNSEALQSAVSEDLLVKLDSNSDGAVDQDELKSALSQKTDDAT